MHERSVQGLIDFFHLLIRKCAKSIVLLQSYKTHTIRSEHNMNYRFYLSISFSKYIDKIFDELSKAFDMLLNYSSTLT